MCSVNEPTEPTCDVISRDHEMVTWLLSRTITLDISLFALLSQQYSQKLDKRMLQLGGLLSISKRIFLKLFWLVYEAAFLSSNIKSA